MATDGQGGGDNSTGDWVDGVPAVAAPNPMAPTVAEPEVTDARHEAAMEADRAAFELLRQSLGMTAEDGFEAVVLRAAEVVSARTSAAEAAAELGRCRESLKLAEDARREADDRLSRSAGWMRDMAGSPKFLQDVNSQCYGRNPNAKTATHYVTVQAGDADACLRWSGSLVQLGATLGVDLTPPEKPA